MSDEPRVLMIGLDGCSPVKLDEWCSDGSLPNLQTLRESGISGSVQSAAGVLPGAVWPTFVTGTDPSYHGVTEFMQWDSALHVFRRPSPAWLGFEPYWRTLGKGGVPSVIMDVPFAQTPSGNGPVTEVHGWGCHDEIVPPVSVPAGLRGELERKFGRSGLKADVGGPRTRDVLRKELAVMVGCIRRRSSIIEDLVTRFPWRHSLFVFAEPHRAGHWLWSDRFNGVPQDGVRRVAIEIDRQLPRFQRLLRPGDSFAVFGLHGMAQAVDIDRFSEVIWDYLEPQTAVAGARRFDPVRMANRMLPQPVRFTISNSLPTKVRDRLYGHTLGVGRDWSQTKTIATQPDARLYFRANLVGREAQGIVEPEDLESHLQWLTEELMAVRNDHGQPVFRAIDRPQQIYPDGPRKDHLPDITAQVFDRPIGETLTMRDGSRLTVPWRNYRDGEHRDLGFYSAVGPGIKKGSKGKPIKEEALAAYFLSLAGVEFNPALG